MNQFLRDKQDVETLGNWRRSLLFHFKNEIAKCLLTKPKLRRTRFSFTSQLTIGRKKFSLESSSDEEDKVFNPPKKRKREMKIHVNNALRHDGYDHLPKFVEAKYASGCKNQGCRQKPFWLCSRCDVHLCLTRQRNCFREYHIND